VYIELHTSSAFSFLDGASLPGTLVERAAELGYPAVALLDRDGLYGAPQFYRAAKAAGLKAIVGAELTIGARATSPWPWNGRPGRCPSWSNPSRLSQSLPDHHARQAQGAERRVLPPAG
jgi:error-prone DNA polymerase